MNSIGLLIDPVSRLPFHYKQCLYVTTLMFQFFQVFFYFTRAWCTGLHRAILNVFLYLWSRLRHQRFIYTSFSLFFFINNWRQCINVNNQLLRDARAIRCWWCCFQRISKWSIMCTSSIQLIETINTFITWHYPIGYCTHTNNVSFIIFIIKILCFVNGWIMIVDYIQVERHRVYLSLTTHNSIIIQYFFSFLYIIFTSNWNWCSNVFRVNEIFIFRVDKRHERLGLNGSWSGTIWYLKHYRDVQLTFLSFHYR